MGPPSFGGEPHGTSLYRPSRRKDSIMGTSGKEGTPSRDARIRQCEIMSSNLRRPSLPSRIRLPHAPPRPNTLASLSEPTSFSKAEPMRARGVTSRRGRPAQSAGARGRLRVRREKKAKKYPRGYVRMQGEENESLVRGKVAAQAGGRTRTTGTERQASLSHERRENGSRDGHPEEYAGGLTS